MVVSFSLILLCYCSPRTSHISVSFVSVYFSGSGLRNYRKRKENSFCHKLRCKPGVLTTGLPGKSHIWGLYCVGALPPGHSTLLPLSPQRPPQGVSPPPRLSSHPLSLTQAQTRPLSTQSATPPKSRGLSPPYQDGMRVNLQTSRYFWMSATDIHCPLPLPILLVEKLRPRALR